MNIPTPITHIAVHDHCADGLASAMILRFCFPEAKISFVDYNTPSLNDLRPEPGLIFCDITPPTERDEQGCMTQRGRALVQRYVDAGVVVLDHHKTAQDVVEMFGARGVFGDEKTEPGVCGAVLAYREIFSTSSFEQGFTREVADFAALAGIYDTWQRDDPRFEQACWQAAALDFYGPNHFLKATRPVWAVSQSTPWLAPLLPEELHVGRLLFEKKQSRIEEASGSSVCARINGDLYAFFNDDFYDRLINHVAEHLRESELAHSTGLDAVVGFRIDASKNCEGAWRYYYSLRSVRPGFDVKEIAVKLGGGGHSPAAGAGIDVEFEEENPVVVFKRRLFAGNRA